MVGPVNANVVNVVLAVAELDHTIDDPTGVGRQRGFGCFVGCRSTHDGPRPLTPVRGYRADLFRRGRCTLLEGNHLRGRGSASIS